MAGDTGSKQIKISFAVDSVSGEKARRFVQDLTSQIEKLVQATQKAMQSLGGLGQHGGISASNKATLPGMPNNVNTTLKTGGILGGVAGSFQNGSNALKTVIQGTQQTFQTVTSGLKNFVDKADGDINRLNRSVARLTQTMGSLGNVGRSVGVVGAINPGAEVGGGGLIGVPQGLFSRSDYRNAGLGRGAANQAFYNQFTNEELKAINVSPGAVGRQNAAARAAAGKGGYGVIGGAVAAAGQGMGLGSMMGFLGKAGPYAALGAAAIGTANLFASAYEGEKGAKLGYKINEPLERLSRRASTASPFVQQYGAIQGGDIAGQMAFQRALARPDIQKAIGGTQLEREALIRLTSGDSSLKLGSLGSKLKGWGGGEIDEFSSWVSNNPSLTVDEKRQAMELATDQGLRNMGPEQAAQLLKAASDEQNTYNQRTNTSLNRVYGGAMDRVGTLRQMGLGSGYKYKKFRRLDQDGNFLGYEKRATSANYEDMEAHAIRHGWAPGTSSYQTVLGVGAGYNKYVGRYEMPSMQLSGLGNAADLMRMGGVLGGSARAGSDFLHNTVQNSIGRKGLDVAVGRDFFGNMGQHLMQQGSMGAGSTAANYMGIMAGLVGGGMDAPLDVAQQQRRANMLPGGLANYNAFATGTKAPLYDAINTIRSAGIMGGYGGGSEALGGAGIETLTSIARGGLVPEWLRSQGVGKKEALEYLKQQNKTVMHEVNDVYLGTEAGQNFKRMRDSGMDFTQFVASESEGKSAKERAAIATKYAEQFGGVLKTSGLANTAEEGEATFLAQMGGSKEFAPRLNAKGVGVAGPMGAELEALKDQSSRILKLSTEAATNTKALIEQGAFKASQREDAHLAAIESASGGQGQSVQESTTDLIRALQKYAASINAASGNRAAAPMKAR